MSTRRLFLLGAAWVLAAAALLTASPQARAEPWIAVQTGFKCSQCHVNPTGGGLRTSYGDVFAQTLLPAYHIDTGSEVWQGAVTSFLRAGGDLRYAATFSKVRNQPSVNQLQMEQTRLYGEASPIPERLILYVDEQVAPGGALNREAYGLYWSAAHDWYLKAGQMYLPFGLRLQDQTAYVRETTGINMTTPDNAVEFGYLRGPWDVQLDASNGTAGGPVITTGKEYTAQIDFVQPLWRAGVALSINNAAAEGRRAMYGVFGGLKTGPVAWLAEADLVVDHTVPGGLRTAAGLLEANWLIARGHNLKVTAEQLAPDLHVSVRRNGQTRWSAVYEFMPVQFLQLRAGVRYLDGIPQADVQHQQLYFIELHGFF